MTAFQLARRNVPAPVTGERAPLIDGTVPVALDALAAGLPPATAAHRLVVRFGLDPARAELQVSNLLATWRAEGIEPQERDRALAATRGLAGSRLYRPCGQTVRVRYGSAALLRLIDPWLAPTAADGSPSDGFRLDEVGAGVTLRRADGEPVLLPGPEAALERLVRALFDLARPGLGLLARLRGAAVAAGDDALVLAGPSGAGVSTLAAALIHAGLGHVGDGQVAIERTRGRLVPMPLAVATGPGSWPALLRRFPALRHAEGITWEGSPRRLLDLGRHAVPHHARPRVAALVFACYNGGATASLEALTPLEALDRLLAARAWEPAGAEATRRMLAWLGRVPAYALDWGDLDDGVRLARHTLAEACTLAA